MHTLVTGSATGFGRLIVELLSAEGHRVFATMRDTADRNSGAAAALASLPGVRVLELDVTSDSSVDAAVKEAIADAGSIDCVVNNAGFAGFGLTEGFTLDQWQAVFNTNLFGCIRVNRAVLPSMRLQGGGLLVHITSIAGRVATPFFAPYGSSKWALEGYAEALRLELAPLRIDSVVVEPGKYRTDIFNKTDDPASQTEISKAYGSADYSQKFIDWFMSDMDRMAQNPKEVAEKVRDLIAMPFGERPFRTLSGQDAARLKPYNDYADAIRISMGDRVGLPELLQPPPPSKE